MLSVAGCGVNVMNADAPHPIVLHVHRYEEEVVYVLEGAIEIRVGGESYLGMTPS